MHDLKYIRENPEEFDAAMQKRGLQPIAKEIGLLPELERLWLTNAMITDELIETLRGVDTLDYVTFIKPQFGDCKLPHQDLSILGIEIQYANLTEKALNSLGQIATALSFLDCHVKLPASGQVTLTFPHSISFQNSDLSDQSMLQLSDSPRLVSVDLRGTEVSIDGVEAFSKLRPEVYLLAE